jgi:hypothetical protein
MMPMRFRTCVLLLLLLGLPASVDADVLIRWDQEHVPSRESLGVRTLVLPEKNSAAIQNALDQGYALYLEVEAAALARLTPPAERLAGIVVKGAASSAQLSDLRQRLRSRGARVLSLDERGKWPHIRTNWVTKRNDVLQVSSRTSQPWIEQNAALVRIGQAAQSGSALALTYRWEPISLSEIDEGPSLENYLVAIAEVGSFGGNLVLPLHERFQKDLLLGKPEARQWWTAIRRHVEFYSGDLPGRYRPIANIGVVTPEPMKSFEVMNLLARHNLPFEIIAPERLASGGLDAFDVLVVLNQPAGPQLETLAVLAGKGATVIVADAKGAAPWQNGMPDVKTEQRAIYKVGEGRVVEVLKAVGDPNTFALEVRQLLGRERRVIDIWNGITVLTAPYAEPNGKSVLVTALNYAYQPLPVQMRVRGLFSLVHLDSPEEEPTLLPYQHRDGYTEFVIPALRAGGRVFLSHKEE